MLSFIPQPQHIYNFQNEVLFCEHNYHLWATCFLFVGRFACVGLPCFGYFARQAGSCQAIGSDKSARYLTNERYTSTFIVILFFKSQTPVCHTDNHISLQRESKFGQLCRQCLFIILRHTLFVSQSQANYVGKSLHNEPEPGLPHRRS